GAKSGEGLEGLFRRDVHGPRGLTRHVRADGERGEIEGTVGVARVLEVTIVAAVPAEVEALGPQDRPRRPEPAALIGEGAAAPVLRGGADEGHAAFGRRLSPVELGHARDAALCAPRLERSVE